MNWLAEYFSRRTPVLDVAMWIYPPPALGPEGPVVQAPHCLPYPGVELAFTAGEEVRRGTRCDEIPARYAWCAEVHQPDMSRVREMARGVENHGFFRSIEIYPPSRYNNDCLIRVNDAFAFVPVFSADGAPCFSGSCMAQPGEPSSSSSVRLPWLFRGYISI
ncbi:hypothetical protein [Paraburkholderia tropica]|uniref:hypothetical protein n=1 Tax=Paraburkholderia tropica TaxID=92647 RepID=UPI002AB79DC4|nr:hypothetical protein [Paraburkholderia tropica]